MPQKQNVGMEALMHMATSTDIVGFVMVFTCSLQQLATVCNSLQHLRTCSVVTFAGFGPGEWAACRGSGFEQGLARMSCHEQWHFSNPNSEMLPSIINPSFQLNRSKWKTGTPLKCSQMQHGASKTLRFWVQTIFKFCFLFAGGSWEYPGQCGSCCSPGQGCGFEQG